jgi:hypothetical protein
MARGAPKDLSDATIKLEDGTTPTANSLTIAVEDGDLNFEIKQPIYNILDRGSLSHMREADEEPVTGSFSIHFMQAIKATTDSTPEVKEVMEFSGGAASWVTTNDDRGDVKTLTMKFEIVNPDSTLENERITFSKVRFTSIKFEEGRPDKLSVDFQAFQTKPAVAKYT